MSGEFDVSKLEPIIEKAWKGVKKDYKKTIWWEEADLVGSFYWRLRNDFNNGRVVPLLEYNPEPRSDAKPPEKFGKAKYYPTKKTSKSNKSKIHFDLVIAEFGDLCKNQGENLDNPDLMHWHVKHAPIIAMEFKYPLYLKGKSNSLTSDSSNKVKRDFKKLQRIIKVYDAKLCYFCFIAEKRLNLLEEVRNIKNRKKFKIAYGLCNKSEWKIVDLAMYLKAQREYNLETIFDPEINRSTLQW